MREGDHVLEEGRQGEATIVAGPGSGGRKLYLESYGCQMNFSDSEIVASILSDAGYQTTRDADDADLVLLNTCAIRDNAEQRVRNRLVHFKATKRRTQVWWWASWDAWPSACATNCWRRKSSWIWWWGRMRTAICPILVDQVEGGQKAVNTLLSREETYAEIQPVRLDDKGVTAFISIMRGCDNMCSFCVVPFTRGRERSRDPQSIVRRGPRPVRGKGYREVTLLGQNVDSYKWNIDAKGNVKDEGQPVVRFAELMEMVSDGQPGFAGALLDLASQGHDRRRAPRDVAPGQPLQVHPFAGPKRTQRCAEAHEPWIHPRVVPRPHCRHPPHHAGLRHQHRRDHGFCGETQEEHEATLSLMRRGAL